MLNRARAQCSCVYTVQCTGPLNIISCPSTVEFSIIFYTTSVNIAVTTAIVAVVAIVANHLSFTNAFPSPSLPLHLVSSRLVRFGSVIFHRQEYSENKNENAVSLYHINDKLAYAMRIAHTKSIFHQYNIWFEGQKWSLNNRFIITWILFLIKFSVCVYWFSL